MNKYTLLIGLLSSLTYACDAPLPRVLTTGEVAVLAQQLRAVPLTKAYPQELMLEQAELRESICQAQSLSERMALIERSKAVQREINAFWVQRLDLK